MEVGEFHDLDGCTTQAVALLGGRYELRERIATGGMGQVCRALDSVLGREVAVKILKNELVDSPGFVERFRAEARHAAAINHPGVASAYDYGEDSDDAGRVAYLVMELVRGEPLSAVLHREGALPVGVVLSILGQTADALQAAHDLGVVHRDVKPGNLLLVSGTTVKITDFGISVAVDSVPLTEPGQVMGTAHYMAPEQALGREVTPASDIYALGVIGYEMLCGYPPFMQGMAATIAAAHVNRFAAPLPVSVPENLRNLLNESMSKDPAARPASAREFATRVRQIAGESSLPVVLGAGTGQPGVRVDDVVTELVEVPNESTAIMPMAGIRPVAPLADPQRVARSQKHRLPLALIVPVVLLIIVAIAVAKFAASDSRLAAPASPSSDTAAVLAPTVEVSSAALVNRPAADVAALLSSQGLVVQQVPVDATGAPAGLVVGVEPEGPLPVGTTVVLSVSSGVPAEAAREPAGKANETGKGRGKGKD